MADEADLQRLEARLAAIERQLSQGQGQGSGGQVAAQDDANNPVALLAGAIVRSLPSVGSPAQGAQGGASVQADTGDSFFMCCSRYICVTPKCGTGSWC